MLRKMISDRKIDYPESYWKTVSPGGILKEKDKGLVKEKKITFHPCIKLVHWLNLCLSLIQQSG